SLSLDDYIHSAIGWNSNNYFPNFSDAWRKRWAILMEPAGRIQPAKNAWRFASERRLLLPARSARVDLDGCPCFQPDGFPGPNPDRHRNLHHSSASIELKTGLAVTKRGGTTARAGRNR